MKTLYVVATPIGNLSDISKRAVETLENVDVILAEDTRQTIKLLNHYHIKKKMVSYHKYNEKSKSQEIISQLQSGKDMALVSDAGTPCISDPGHVLVHMARQNGINVIGIPGPSATVTSLSISGLDTKSFAFVGFLPTDNKQLEEEIEKMNKNPISTFIIYESPKRLVHLVKILKERLTIEKIFIASDLTKIHERSFFGDIDDVYSQIENDPKIEKGEYVVIIEKGKKISTEEEKISSISLESRLVDIMVQEHCTLKEAMAKLNLQDKKLKKNDIYDASLNLKKLITGKM